MHKILSRRAAIKYGLGMTALLWSSACGLGTTVRKKYQLKKPDENGVQLLGGYTSRILAISGEPPVVGSNYLWHIDPDGGAVFPSEKGGWIYVSNSEANARPAANNGGVGALVFDRDGNVIDAYSILTGTSRNCAGGKTPWNTWLSCEEFGDIGKVYECDPFGKKAAVERGALGVFNHEAVAVDPIHLQLYLTEDRIDGKFYRFTPARILSSGIPDLSAGKLEVAKVDDGKVVWLKLHNPEGRPVPTRYQVSESTSFNRSEGIDHFNGMIYFATTGDNRIWKYTIKDSSFSIIYDANKIVAPRSRLTGLDNLTVNPKGDMFVAEDRGNEKIGVITASGEVIPMLRLVGHERPELTGPAFDLSGTRLYFSLQRERGLTFEIRGPFEF